MAIKTDFSYTKELYDLPEYRLQYGVTTANRFFWSKDYTKMQYRPLHRVPDLKALMTMPEVLRPKYVEFCAKYCGEGTKRG